MEKSGSDEETTSAMAIPDDVKLFVDSKIASKRFVVFSKSYCPHSKAAKALIESRFESSDVKYWRSQHYEVVELDKLQGYDYRAVSAYLSIKTGRQTVPQCFVNGQCVGGNTEIQAFEARGELKQLVYRGL